MIMNNLSVVMYHYVRRIKHSRFDGIKGLELDDFVEQIKFLKKNYNVVTSEQVMAYYQSGEELPNNAALLTFDDGYAEHFNHVYPILKKFDVQGSFYIPAKTVLENCILDVNKIHFILASCQDTQILIQRIKKLLVRYSQDYELRSFDDYYTEFAVANRFDSADVIFVKRLLQHALPEALRNIIADELFVEYIGMDEASFSRELYMDEHQISHLIKDGMHVGSHGYDHYWWNRLSATELNKEIDLSLDFLNKVGADNHNWSACYPYGSSSDEVVRCLQQKGCKLALTTVVDTANLTVTNPLLIPRLDTNDLPKQANAKPNIWFDKC
jgi:peptidoglycan/xylan/chitin deacetylase (PgdA/CDA1 family)